MHKNNFSAVLCGALVTLTSSIVVAAEATVGDLTYVQSQLILKTAQVALATQEEALRKLNGGGAAAGVVAVPGDLNEPTVRSISGVNGKLFATFMYSTGAIADAAQGETLPGGYKVTFLSIDKVELQKNGKILQVGFSSRAPAAAGNTGGVIPQPSFAPPQPFVMPLGQ